MYTYNVLQLYLLAQQDTQKIAEAQCREVERVGRQKDPQLLSPNTALRIRTESSSRKNFAANLVRELFSPEERAISKYRGTNGKKKLDQERINAIQGTLFRLWTLESKENQQDARLTAKKAIDEANRRLNRC